MDEMKKIYAVAVNLEDLDSGLITLQQTSVAAENRFEAIGRAVDRFLSEGSLIHSYKVTINDGQENLSEVIDFLLEGKKIAAIKCYREMTGIGLKEAKDAVDRIETEYNIKRDSRRNW
jgi:ribosomal protein L7/L12